MLFAPQSRLFCESFKAARSDWWAVGRWPSCLLHLAYGAAFPGRCAVLHRGWLLIQSCLGKLLISSISLATCLLRTILTPPSSMFLGLRGSPTVLWKCFQGISLLWILILIFIVLSKCLTIVFIILHVVSRLGMASWLQNIYYTIHLGTKYVLQISVLNSCRKECLISWEMVSRL